VPPRALRSLLIGSVIAIALAVFLFVGLGHHGAKSTSSGPVVGVGSVAPGFSLPSLTGGAPVDLDALGKDRHRPVVLNFFGSWCIPCQAETPLLARTAAAEQAQGSTVQFIGIDVNDAPSSALAFVHKAGITYPVGADRTFQVSSGKYGLYGLPQTFYIDASGTVIGHTFGAVKTAAELQGWIHKLTAGNG
jgi:cytochrome c biogenesis protein CcmG/thiol:disulfide interchange protein DsbE